VRVSADGIHAHRPINLVVLSRLACARERIGQVAEALALVFLTRSDDYWAAAAAWPVGVILSTT
jgi:hypothetical protein